MQEVVDRCNATPYGLTAGIVTKDINKVFYFTKHVKAGKWHTTNRRHSYDNLMHVLNQVPSG